MKIIDKGLRAQTAHTTLHTQRYTHTRTHTHTNVGAQHACVYVISALQTIQRQPRQQIQQQQE